MHSLPRSLAVTLFIALFVGQGCTPAQAPDEANKGPAAAAPSAVTVRRAVVSKRPMPAELRLTGSLVANEEADVAANASGRVAKTLVERGSQVAVGDPLVQLDQRQVRISADEARANLEVVQAQRELADLQCKRNEALFTKGAISKDEWDRVDSACQSSQSSVRAAEARTRQASRSLDDATVRAPFAGVVGERFVSTGEYVTPSSKVVSLTQLNPLRLQVGVPEAYIGAVSMGQQVLFEVEAHRGTSFVGQVKFVGPSVRMSSRDLVVEAQVDNANHVLRPGMFADVRLQLPDKPMVVVPKGAIARDSDFPRVFVIEGGRLEEHVVALGPERDDVVAIVRGLEDGAQIAAELPSGVRDGMLVTP